MHRGLLLSSGMQGTCCLPCKYDLPSFFNNICSMYTKGRVLWSSREQGCSVPPGLLLPSWSTRAKTVSIWHLEHCSCSHPADCRAETWADLNLCGGKCSNFTIQLFSIPATTAAIPTYWAPTAFLGNSSALPLINLTGVAAFRALVPQAPAPPAGVSQAYAPLKAAWKIFGVLYVRLAGKYTFCVNSADGSFGAIAGYGSGYTSAVNYDGIHDASFRACGGGQRLKALSPISILVSGFNVNGPPVMRFTYSGPDTGNIVTEVRSISSALPDKIPEKIGGLY